MALLKIKRKGERKSSDNVKGDTDGIMPLDRSMLGISDAAAIRLKQLLDQKEGQQYFRVAIRGGGCSGLSIHYEFTPAVRDNDVVFSKDDVMVIIDKKSLALLGGATLHVRDYLGAKEFMLVNNPAAKQCSCGQSFSL